MTSETDEELTHQYYLELARRSPQLSLDDPRMRKYFEALERGEEDIEFGHRQPMNNFHIIFQEMFDPRQDPLDNVPLNAVEALGEPWQNFIRQNEVLLQNIRTALIGVNSYRELNKYSLMLVKNGQDDLEKQLSDATKHPLGIEAIGISAWDILNPLLEEAAQKMELCGIDPQPHFR